ncbi:MAG: hypothetical protein ACI9WU_001405 [Myxococcota bacterium]
MVRIASLLVLAFVIGCGGGRSSGLCERVNIDDAKPGDVSAAESAAAAGWAKRADMKSAETAVAEWRKAVAIAPQKTDNYLRLAKALYFYADGHLRFDEDREEEMIKAFEEATFFAERALQIQNPDFQFSVCSREPFEKSVRKLRKADVPAVYWYAAALGKYGLAKSIVVVLDNKDRIYAMMKRVQKMAPEFHHGAADRYLGAFYTKIPFPKGDMRKSRGHFERSIKASPNYLATRVLVAEMLAPKLKDRALFERSLKYVLDAPADIIPELAAEHAIEKRKAALLMEDIDTYFAAEE